MQMKKSKALSAQLRRWKVLQRQVCAAMDAATAAERAFTDFVRAHLRKHPLSEWTQGLLVERVRSGRGLCCQEGREWLASTVDPIWTGVLNAWAYEHLSCYEGNPPHWGNNAQRLQEKLAEARWEPGE